MALTKYATRFRQVHEPTDDFNVRTRQQSYNETLKTGKICWKKIKFIYSFPYFFLIAFHFNCGQMVD